MEGISDNPSLLSEKQAAVRLGVARITLLRAREAGRIRFFRIGTRVLYCGGAARGVPAIVRAQRQPA